MEDLKKDIQLIFNSLGSTSDKKYWFIRTQGGEFYQSFKKGGFIGIGYPEMENSKILELATLQSRELRWKSLSSYVEEKYPDHPRKGFIVSQVNNFIGRFTKGDIVLIPGGSGFLFTIGEVESREVFIENNNNNLEDCSFRIRKKVRWLAEVSRRQLHPDLTRAIQNRKAITEISQYGIFIERNINPIFRKNDDLLLSLDFKTKDEIPYHEFSQLNFYLDELTNELCNEIGLQESEKNFRAKFQLSSEGFILLSGHYGILVLLTIIALSSLRRSKTKFDWEKWKVSYESEGESILDPFIRLLKSVSDFYDKKSDRNNKTKVVDKILEKMEFDNTPYELSELRKLLISQKEELNKEDNDKRLSDNGNQGEL